MNLQDEEDHHLKIAIAASIMSGILAGNTFPELVKLVAKTERVDAWLANQAWFCAEALMNRAKQADMEREATNGNSKT